MSKFDNPETNSAAYIASMMKSDGNWNENNKYRAPQTAVATPEAENQPLGLKKRVGSLILGIAGGELVYTMTPYTPLGLRIITAISWVGITSFASSELLKKIPQRN